MSFPRARASITFKRLLIKVIEQVLKVASYQYFLVTKCEIHEHLQTCTLTQAYKIQPAFKKIKTESSNFSSVTKNLFVTKHKEKSRTCNIVTERNKKC